MSATEVHPQPCQCLRTKNPYGTTPQNAESWLPGVAATSTYLVLAHDGARRTRRALRTPLPLHILSRLLRSARRLKRSKPMRVPHVRIFGRGIKDPNPSTNPGFPTSSALFAPDVGNHRPLQRNGLFQSRVMATIHISATEAVRDFAGLQAA